VIHLIDVLLIASPEYRYVKAFSACEYLGLEYIAAFLRKHGYSVLMLNCNLNTTVQQAAEIALKENPKIIGISVPTIPNLPGTFDLVKNLRNCGYSGHICFGGHVATFSCRDILETMQDVDTIVRGEGELTFLKLLQTIESGEPLTKVDGIAFKNGKDVIINPARELIHNIDDLPFPSRDILAEIIDNNPELARASIAAGRGCYGKCTFCSVRAFYELSAGPKIRLRSPENVVDEIEYLVKRYNISEISFVDDNFIGPGKIGQKRASGIAEEILNRKLNITFTLYCRVNDINEFLFKLLKKAGLVRVFVGIESGVQTVLNRFNKGVTVEQNSEAINLLRRLGIAWDAGFILYDPSTTFEELKENIKFIRKTTLYRYPAATLLLNGLTVYPGTPIEQILKDEGRLKPIKGTNSKIIGNPRDGIDSLSSEISKLLDSDYVILDKRAQKIREFVDLTEDALSPQYDIIWPLLSEWRHWLESGMETTGFNLETVKSITEFKLILGDQMERWIENIGTLIINILETFIEFFEDDSQIEHAEILKSQIYSMIYQFNFHHFETTFKEKMLEIQELMNKKQFKFQIDGSHYLLSMASKSFIVDKSSNK
jgi:anaerobic magnesium-protoporphyrin IX monomethyl ester cyclase